MAAALSPTWSTACLDWERRIVEGESLIPCAPLFPEAAEQGMEVFNALRLADVVGQPTLGESCRPWLKNFAATVFGSYNPETGQRLISEYLLLVSKKNTKSTIAAGVMLTVLIQNWRESAEFLILAPTKEAADNAFKPAQDMIRLDPDLDDLLHVAPNQRIITHRITGATLRVVAADGTAVVGKKATGVLVDELWEFGKRPTAQNMLMEATGGIASRPEGFVIYLTTQSEESPAGVFKDKLEYGRKVRDGKIIAPHFLAVIYEFPKGMLKRKEHQKPENWYITNPNLGLSVTLEWLKTKYSEALEAGEGVLTVWMAKHLNVQVGISQGASAWVGIKYWMRQADPELTLQSLIERSDVIVGGIDGGGVDDFLSLAVLGRDAETDDWLHWQRSWVFHGALEERKKEASRYLDFEKQGDLWIMKEMSQDFIQLADIAEELDDSGKLAMIGLDPAGVAEIVLELSRRGIMSDRIVGISQGWKLTGPIKTLERKLADGKFWHGGRPIMAWAIGNAMARPKGNNIEITKEVAGGKKIDPLMALFDAVACMSRNPEPPIQSIYDREELWES
ncbi:phage terminase large subunit [Acetobacter senegalensis DSM 18889]|nr:phage terminase large subunit [Acetobacter senegalensis DSM 18889]